MVTIIRVEKKKKKTGPFLYAFIKLGLMGFLKKKNQKKAKKSKPRFDKVKKSLNPRKCINGSQSEKGVNIS